MSEQSEIPKQPKGWNPIYHPIRNTVIFTALILTALFICLYIWGLTPFLHGRVSTNNAYIQGHTTVISPQVSGYVQKVQVSDFEQVKKNDLLLEIDRTSYQAALQQAIASEMAAEQQYYNADQAIASAEAQLTELKAKVNSAEVNLHKSELDYQRLEKLIVNNAATRSDFDHAKTDLDQAKAALAEENAAYKVAEVGLKTVQVNKKVLKANWDNSIANRQQAQINLDHTIIKAPLDGKLSTIGVKEGAYISTGSALMYLVPKDAWVIANFKENDISNIKVGQKATFTVDALQGRKFTALVSDISPATGAEFSVVANNHATGNFVKVTQRVPIKLSLDPKIQDQSERLLPGLSVEATIFTN